MNKSFMLPSPRPATPLPGSPHQVYVILLRRIEDNVDVIFKVCLHKDKADEMLEWLAGWLKRDGKEDFVRAALETHDLDDSHSVAVQVAPLINALHPHPR
jgi:hypothetical protein